MRKYGIYRYGSNSANQPLCNKRLVAIVEASSREAALKKARDLPVTVYHNQHLDAVAQRFVPKAEWEEASGAPVEWI